MLDEKYAKIIARSINYIRFGFLSNLLWVQLTNSMLETTSYTKQGRINGCVYDASSIQAEYIVCYILHAIIKHSFHCSDRL